MKGLENAIRNLNSLDTRMVPQASAWAINRVAQKAVSVATRQVAGNTVAGDNQVKGIPLKLVRQRVRVFKASPSGKMTDGDDWQAVLYIAVFIRAQAPDSELDMWMESTIFPALNDVPALSGLIDTLNPLGFNYQRDNEMATWAMAEITYQITYTN